MADDADSPGPIASLETSAHGQILNEIADATIDLALTGIDGNVWIRDPPTIEGITLPCVILSPYTPSHSPADGAATQADFVWRTMAAVVKASGRKVNYTLAERLAWYDALIRRFAKRGATFNLDGVAADVQLLYVTIEPGDPRIIAAWELSFDAIWLSIACHVRYPSPI
ncbi:MAG: hypothetical protein H0T51_15095 [Pirellulales bacterium]|nr:hypothetical protein [Pirellulales bacterium]